MYIIVDDATKTAEMIDGPRLKKITATRLAAVLGFDEYTTEFGVWADIVGAYKEDLRDNKFLIAGKLLEPKIIEFLKQSDSGYTTPEEFFGKRVRDIDPSDEVIGGIPDLFHVDRTKALDGVVELKTFSRFDKWTQGPPKKYIVQAALYTYMLQQLGHKVDSFHIIGLYIGDYDIANLCELDDLRVAQNKLLCFEYSLSKDFPDFGQEVQKARDWYAKYVLTGKSPVYDTLKDYATLRYIEEYQRNFSSEELHQTLERYEFLMQRKAALSALIDEDAKEMKKLQAKLKPAFSQKLIPGVFGNLNLTLTETVRETVNKDKLKEAGLFDTYIKTSKSLTFKSDLTPVVLETKNLKVVFVDAYGEVKFRNLQIINGSVIAGAFKMLQGPVQLLGTEHYVLCYKDIAETMKSRVFELFGLMQAFDACVVYRKDLGDMDDTALGEFMEEFSVVYTPPQATELPSDEEETESIMEAVDIGDTHEF